MKRYLLSTIGIYLILTSIVALIEGFRRFYFNDADATLEFLSFFVLSVVSGAVGIPIVLYQIEHWDKNK